jgi:hypothetical protein
VKQIFGGCEEKVQLQAPDRSNEATTKKHDFEYKMQVKWLKTRSLDGLRF